MRGQELQQELQDGSALLQPCSDNPASIRSADVHRLMTSVSIFSWLLSLFLWLCLFYRVNFCDVSLCLSQLLTVNLYIVFQSFCQQNVMFVSAQWACLWDIYLTWTCLTLKLLELTQELATASTVLSSRLWSCSSSGDLSSSRMSSMTSGPTWSLLPRSFCITCSSTYSMPTTSSSMAAGSSVRLPAGLPVRLTWFYQTRCLRSGWRCWVSRGEHRDVLRWRAAVNAALHSPAATFMKKTGEVSKQHINTSSERPFYNCVFNTSWIKHANAALSGANRPLSDLTLN